MAPSRAKWDEPLQETDICGGFADGPGDAAHGKARTWDGRAAVLAVALPAGPAIAVPT
jgi:hypothetical protein